MQFLDRSASGTRTVAWARKIIANGRAHLEFNHLLTGEQQHILSVELPKIEEKIHGVANAHDSYRHFLDTTFVSIGARQRVANFLVDVAFEEGRAYFVGKKRQIEADHPGFLARFLSGNPLSRVLRAGNVRTVLFARTAAHTVSSLSSSTFPQAPAIESSLHSSADLLESFNNERAQLNGRERPPLKVAVERASTDLREALIRMNSTLRLHFPEMFIESLYPRLAKRGGRIVDVDDEDNDEEVDEDVVLASE